MGPLNSEWPCRKYPPSIQSLCSVPVHLPPGPIGPGFMSPSMVQVPANASSFFNSGAGFGISIWACAENAAPSKSMAYVMMVKLNFIESLLRLNSEQTNGPNKPTDFRTGKRTLSTAGKAEWSRTANRIRNPHTRNIRIGFLHYSGHIHQNVTPSASGLFCLPCSGSGQLAKHLDYVNNRMFLSA